MQNAPAMLAQKMMNQQAPYGPVGMVSQNMSGNKKSSGPVSYTGPLVWDVATATSGLTFSGDLKTVTNSTAGNITSSKTLYQKSNGKWYIEFTKNSTSTDWYGLGPSSFVCNTSNRVGVVATTISIFCNTVGSAVYIQGTPVASGFSIANNGDKIGISYNLTGSFVAVEIFLNGVSIYSILGGIGAMTLPNIYVPIWSSNQTSASAVISTTPTYPPPSGFTYLGPG